MKKMVDNNVDIELVPVSKYTDEELLEFMKKNGISLKIDEARSIVEKLGRDPTLVELHIFNIEWSEHCSYKSSRNVLKLLPTDGPTVIQGPKEDAGIIKFTDHEGESYGIVIAHESHNHPSQVVPYEGAATGIGGIVRDVLCMGAKVIATADPLRFGSLDPKSPCINRTKYIVDAVVDGIAGYGNPIGIPNLGGDAYFNKSFDENCLVNVACLGLIKEKEIIHSTAPENSDGFDVILIGKATDNSGFGGAAFASLVLDEKDEDANKCAVQVPDPFLKNVLIRACYDVFKRSREKNIDIGFKDCGAGGIMCVTSELGSDAEVGMDIDLDKVHTSMKIPEFIVACSETQERFGLVCPSGFTEEVLKIFNEDWELPKVAEGAKAVVIGKVTKEQSYIMRSDGKIVCNAPIKVITSGIKYDREKKESVREFEEPNLEEPTDYNHVVRDVLSHPNVASKAKFYKHYDTQVQGNTIIQAGYADAGVMCPIPGCKAGLALSVDCNPRFTKINPYMGSVNAVAEAMRNVAAVGAVPYGMTDCLCFGNPEIPELFNDFYECVRGISDAAKKICVKGTNDPVPFVSGNVSFYNESSKGVQVDPSPIIACLGVMRDASKAITMKLKSENSVLLLVGPRKDELGGSVYYDLHEKDGKNMPQIDFDNEKVMIYGIIDCIEKRLLRSCHDISDGGVVVSVVEMILGGDADGKIGVELQFNDELRTDKLLFSESSGFVMEVDIENVKEIEELFKVYEIDVFKIGETKGSELVINHNEKEVVKLSLEQLKDSWYNGLEEALE